VDVTRFGGRFDMDPIQLVLHTPDLRLQPLIAAALKPEYAISVEVSKEKIKQIASQGNADVLLLDFDTNNASIEAYLAFYDEVGDSDIPIVVMTDDLRRSTATALLQRGAYDCIRKPPSLIELKVIVQRASEHGRMKRELARVRERTESSAHCDQLVGSSGKSQVIYDLIQRVANLSASVLITGESGTGKELVARAIHNLGNRAGRPFVAVSCGAIPETLIESELFGHEKGAYTGSTGVRAGYLEQAGEGTLFLDEIGELSLNTQVKLLRVLQQKEFCRLGGNKLIPLNARVVFATHRNLQQMVEAGTFRQDLFFRVNVMRIHVPPLRDRTEDIPMLARYFLKKFAQEYEKPVADIRPNAMEALVEYDWPGNIRELENVIQGAVILADGNSIARSDLPEHLQISDIEESEVADIELAPNTFDELLRQYKVSLANRAVLECNGNKTLAARKLRVSRAYLHRLIRMGPESASDTIHAA
jgi:DNA-binding NtrC family response regulator